MRFPATLFQPEAQPMFRVCTIILFAFTLANGFTEPAGAVFAGPAGPLQAATAPSHGEAKIAPPVVSLGENEITISAGTAGASSLTYPYLVTTGDKEIHPQRIRREADAAVLSYPGGGTGRVLLEQSTLRISFADMKPEFKQFRMLLSIPINFAGGGTYSIAGTAERTFPDRKTYRAVPLSRQCRSAGNRSPDRAWFLHLSSLLFVPATAGQPRVELEHLSMVVRDPIPGRQLDARVCGQDRAGRRSGRRHGRSSIVMGNSSKPSSLRR